MDSGAEAQVEGAIEALTSRALTGLARAVAEQGLDEYAADVLRTLADAATRRTW